MGEAAMHERNCFLTLTYDQANLPPDGSLNVNHWQNFAKRARKRLGKFRFFHCGEYGDLNGRPHYHAAIFGQDFSFDREFWKNTKTGDPLWTSPTLSKLWPEGLHAIGDLTFDSAAYVARYVMKKVNGSQAEYHYLTHVDYDTGECHYRKPEYATMSRNKGIGETWIKKYMSDVYPSDELVVNGKITRPPKFYDQQFEKADPKGYRKLKAQRIKIGSKHPENNTYDRLEVRETVQIARIRELTREI